MTKLTDIRARGFYTDGMNVYRNQTGKKGGRILIYCPSFNGNKMFLKSGITCAYYTGDKEIEVRLVEAGEQFLNGDIKVIDVKTLELKKVSYKGRKVNGRGETINADKLEYVESFEKEAF